MPDDRSTWRAVRRGGVRRILVIAIVLVGLGAASVAGFGLLNYEPLAQGSTSYGGDPHLLLATTEDDETTAYHFRYAPSGSFTTAFSVGNDGPVAVTLLGADLHDETEATLADTALLWPHQLSIARPDPLGDWTDPTTAPPIDHAVIQPGSELILWVRWRLGSSCEPGKAPPYFAGTAIGVGPRIDLRWSVFSIPRSSAVDMGYKVWADNPAEDPLTVCPAPPA
jgi:hypothetical protein